MDHYTFFEGNDQSNNYTQFRPKTPEKILDWILEYLSEQIKTSNDIFSAAADVGCGTGQCTELLAKYFKNVYGFDVAESQINQAKLENSHHNILYMVFNNIELTKLTWCQTLISKVSPAEQISLPDHSLDLITCSQCFHWFNFESFYTEVRRLLKPGGVLALITYIRPLIVHSDEEIKYLKRNTFKDPPLNAFVDEKLNIVDNGYANLVLPFNDVRRKEINIYADNVSGSQVIGYIKSWSSYGQLIHYNSEAANQMVTDIESKIKGKTGKDIGEKQFTLDTPFYLILARK